MMPRLVVLGSEGGVGKTVIAAALADLADPPLALLDCNPDNPNLGLLVPHRVTDAMPFMGPEQARIDPDRCMRCRRCLTGCRFGAIGECKDTLFLLPGCCAGCGVCAAICPADAIAMTESMAGELVFSITQKGRFLHGRLLPGVDDRGLMVRELWRLASISSLRDGWILADGPRATGHQLIYTLGSVDTVLLVVEPTLSSLYRMRRLLTILRRFPLTLLAVINRFDLDPEYAREAELLTKSEGVPIVGRVPLDPGVMDSLRAGCAVTRCECNAASAIRELWKNIRTELEKRREDPFWR